MAIAQQLNYKTVDKKGREKLLGKITKEGLQQDSFANWFNPQYENYQVDEETVQALRKQLKRYEIKVFLGTWCGDSRREVPRFIRILEAADFPKENLSIIAVDYEKPFYKKSPGGEEKGLNIVKVPTFIFYKKGAETNRIIEYPVVSLEKDMAKILKEEGYKPNFSGLKAN
ncbi:thiol reductase thioredoxin [Flavobacteriaceae bacterium R33]|uniref:Thiol reductase thioredoxin n=2 Tax=Poritiphilus flavus TaxID=2697053 RepID=A0A6L9E861_9FLAO|nr:thiol reductase thioredoxin [Poritiphilus flavus]